MRCRALILALTCGLALGALPRAALAALQSCSVTATPVLFGTYSITSVSVTVGSGTITVTCTVTGIALLESWNIALSAGNSGSFAQRRMTTGSSTLLYNLYTLATLATVWGDGTGGSSKVFDTELLAVGTTAYPYAVYGIVNPLQDQSPGTYTDIITVTVMY